MCYLIVRCQLSNFSLILLQVILYKLAGGTFKPQDLKPSSTKKWDYIGCVRAHTHDIRALTVAVPISSEGQWSLQLLCFYYFQYILNYNSCQDMLELKDRKHRDKLKAFNRKKIRNYNTKYVKVFPFVKTDKHSAKQLSSITINHVFHP